MLAVPILFCDFEVRRSRSQTFEALAAEKLKIKVASRVEPLTCTPSRQPLTVLPSTAVGFSATSLISSLMAGVINMLSARVQDIEIEDNFNPIAGLDKVPIVSLEEAMKAATADKEFSEHDLSINKNHALKFGRQLKKKSSDAEVLNVEEIAAIQLYTQQTVLFSMLNARLRNRDREFLKPFLLFIKLFLSAIYKLTPISQALFRGVKKNLTNFFAKGDEKTWWGFSSTTRSAEVLTNEEFLGLHGQRTLFHINGLHAYDISKYSAFPNEQELLLPAGSEFVVEGILPLADDLRMIQLRQIPYQFLFPVNVKLLVDATVSNKSPLYIQKI